MTEEWICPECNAVLASRNATQAQAQEAFARHANGSHLRSYIAKTKGHRSAKPAPDLKPTTEKTVVAPIPPKRPELSSNQLSAREELFAQLLASGEATQELPLGLITEALQNYKTPILNPADALYVLACHDLLNAWVKTDHAKQHAKRHLNVNPNKFKTLVAITIAELIKKRFEDVKVWMEEDFTYVRLFGVDFSFHHLPLNATLQRYQFSSRNIPHTWSQFRPQPRAPLALNWARQMRIEYQSLRSPETERIISTKRKSVGPKRKKQEKTNVSKNKKKKTRVSKYKLKTDEKDGIKHGIKFWSAMKTNVGGRPMQGGLPGLGRRH